ncbi:unnamed protein product [Parnassius mnemosyne]|uniref:Integrase catalytic domain-containing protein n=1 Tax=Parnassius mnemosyne TaxID=213953 RepID=A0AAV1LL65_9NEOP
MYSTSAKVVISKLRELFARFGLPLQIVTDNGPPFTSLELTKYFNKMAFYIFPPARIDQKATELLKMPLKQLKTVLKKLITRGQISNKHCVKCCSNIGIVNMLRRALRPQLHC